MFTDEAYAHELVLSKELNKYKQIHNFIHNHTIIIVKYYYKIILKIHR